MTFHPVTDGLREWGQRVAAARVQADLSQSDLAKKAGVVQAFVSSVETGKGMSGQTISSDTLAKFHAVATALAVPMPAEYATPDIAPTTGKRIYTPRASKPVVRRRSRAEVATGSSGEGFISQKALFGAVKALVGAGKLDGESAMSLLSLGN